MGNLSQLSSTVPDSSFNTTDRSSPAANFGEAEKAWWVIDRFGIIRHCGV